MAWEYSQKTKQLFLDAMNSKPGTHLGSIPDADAIGEDGSLVCGDAMKIYLKIEKHHSDPLQDKIVSIKYETFGCTSAIASSEALCQMIEAKNLTPLEALKIENKDIVEFLGGLPDQKIHCSVMGAQALESAVNDWATKRGVDLCKYRSKDHTHDEEHEEGRIVCSCFSISEPYLLRKIKELDLKTIDDVRNATKAGGACKACIERPGGIMDCLKSVWGDSNISSKDQENYQAASCNFKEKIYSVIEKNVVPLLKLHGGGISVVEVKDNKVYCTLHGACGGCAGARFTIKNIVEKELKEKVDTSIVVIEI